MTTIREDLGVIKERLDTVISSMDGIKKDRRDHFERCHNEMSNHQKAILNNSAKVQIHDKYWGLTGRLIKWGLGGSSLLTITGIIIKIISKWFLSPKNRAELYVFPHKSAAP